MKASLLTLHVGLAKTGTSSIQQTLFEDHPQIYYLGKYGKPPARVLPTNRCRDDITYRFLKPLLWELDEPIDFEANSRLFHDEILPSVPENRIILGSWEELGELGVENYGKLLDRCQEVFGTCRIIVTLRNPLEILPSLYLQNLRVNYLQKMHREWIDIETYRSIERWYRKKVESRTILNYCENIRTSVDKLGHDNVGIFLYEDLKNTPEDYYRSLCEFIGVDSDIGMSLIEEKHLNPRLTKVQLAHMRKMNSSWYWRVYGSLMPRKIRYVKFRSMQHGPPAEVSLTEELIREVSDLTRDGHRYLVDVHNLKLEKYAYPL